MRPEKRDRYTRRLGLPLAAVIAFSGFVGANQAQARPSHADLQSARSRLNALNDRMDVLVERYDQAQVALSDAQKRLAEARVRMATADAQAAAARRELERRATLAYEGVGSELDTLFGAADLSQLSDRLEFLNQIAGSDADAVAKASVAGQRAAWARTDLNRAVAQRTSIVQAIAKSKSQILISVTQQRALIDRLQKALSRPVYQPQAPAPSAPTIRSVPVVNGSAQAAVDAAYSVIGVKYTYAGSSPETG